MLERRTDAALDLSLRQAGFVDVTPDDYRTRVAVQILAFGAAGAGFGALVFHRPLAAVGLARVRRGVRRRRGCGVGSSAASPIAASGSGSSCTP